MLFYAVFCVLSVGFGNARVGKDNFVHGPDDFDFVLSDGEVNQNKEVRKHTTDPDFNGYSVIQSRKRAVGFLGMTLRKAFIKGKKATADLLGSARFVREFEKGHKLYVKSGGNAQLEKDFNSIRLLENIQDVEMPGGVQMKWGSVGTSKVVMEKGKDQTSPFGTMKIIQRKNVNKDVYDKIIYVD